MFILDKNAGKIKKTLQIFIKRYNSKFEIHAERKSPKTLPRGYDVYIINYGFFKSDKKIQDFKALEYEQPRSIFIGIGHIDEKNSGLQELVNQCSDSGLMVDALLALLKGN